MKLIFIRHGAAGDKYDDPEVDFYRELTPKGKKKLQKSFKQFKKNKIDVDVIFTSPLSRALQTAEVFWKYHKKSDLELTVDLIPENNPFDIIEYISFLPRGGTYAFVGHEPLLSQVISIILSAPPGQVSLKKGQILILEDKLLRRSR